MINIVDQLQTAYVTHRWMRFVLCICLLLTGALLYWIPGGFPPWAWRFLFQVIPQVPGLWQVHGLPVIFPFAGLLLLSAALLIAWGAFALICLRVIGSWWQERQELRRFEADVLEAQYLSETMPGEQEPGRPVFPGSPVPGQPLQSKRKSRGIYLDIGTGLNAGIKRRGNPNEDSLLALENLTSSMPAPQPAGLFIVADGMGGHGNGREASQLAIRAMRDNVLMALRSDVEENMLEQLLVEAAQSANRSVYQRNQHVHADMGTTMTAALIWGTAAYLVNVGDSRTYIYREMDGLFQVTQDHSVVARLVAHGAITADEVYTHPRRNQIYRSLGNTPSAEVDSFTVSLQVGDILLLCSDGLWEMVHDSQIEEIITVSAPYASQICAMLVQAALNRGGKDNISVIAVCVRED